MKNKYLGVFGILLLSGALLFGNVTGNKTVNAASCQCGDAGTCSIDQSPACGSGCMRADGKCKCMDDPARKQAHEAFMARTSGMRKELAVARENLNTFLQKKPVDRQRAFQLAERVNALQSQLYSIAAAAYIETCGQSCVEDCKCCKDPIVCIMMMSEQCPMKYCKKVMGCAKGCGSAKGGKCTCDGCKPDCKCANGGACTCSGGKDKECKCGNCGCDGCKPDCKCANGGACTCSGGKDKECKCGNCACK